MNDTHIQPATDEQIAEIDAKAKDCMERHRDHKCFATVYAKDVAALVARIDLERTARETLTVMLREADALIGRLRELAPIDGKG